MASIFLSYARDDAASAKALANVLERAGHKVWWDRHISGGSEFSDEIEAALKSAEVVLVLWSKTSVRSAWVRDEAAEGRDSGRLVPVLLDDSAPPLGFRQIQSVSIGGWSGRGNPPDFQTILAAIGTRSGHRQETVEPARSRATGNRRLALAGFIGIAAIFLAIGAWWLVSGRITEARTPVLAVLPFSDLSPERDKAYLAEGVAEAILTVLAKEPGIKVLGRSSAKQLHEAGGEAPDIRRALGITHVLEGSARSLGDQLRMSVRLIDASDGRQVWAEEYQRRLDNIFAVQDEIGRAVALKLRGSIGQKPAVAAQATSADAYTLYLAARAKMRDRRASSLKEALELARKVIATDSNYAPGHALYAELLEHMSYDNYGNLPPERVKQLALPHARRAVRLAPNSAEGYAALGMILRGAEAVAPLQRAIQLDPSRAELRLWLAHAFNALGKNEQALREIEAAAQMEPLWPTIIMTQAYVLWASGRMAEAEAVIRRFEERGGSKARAAKIRGDIAGWTGNISEGIRLIQQAIKADPEVPLANMSLAWFYGAVGLNDRAAAAAKSLPRYTQLYVTGEYSALADLGRREGPAIWNQPDPDVVVDALVIQRDWPTITRLVDPHQPILGLVCSDNRPWMIQLGLNLSQALKKRGRNADSRRFLDCTKANLEKTGSGPIRTPYLANNALHLMQAQVHAIEGRPDQALTLLDRAVRTGFRTRLGSGLAHYPAFDRLRSAAQYGRLDARLKQLTEAERAEVLRLPSS